MSDSKKTLLLPRLAVLTAAAGVGLICVMVRHRSVIAEALRHTLDFRNALRNRHIEIIETADDCARVVTTLKKHCDDYKVLGFDCEWVTVGGTCRPAALLQLSSRQGLCALFRLCCLQQVPTSLRDLLEDASFIKVGVAPQHDARKLAHDYGVGVASTFDLRFLAAMTGHRPDGLAKLSLTHLKVELDKNWRLVCSDWEANVLSEKQLHYAANDALVAIEIFKKLGQRLEPSRFWRSNNHNFSRLRSRLEPFFGVPFKESMLKAMTAKTSTFKTGSKASPADWKLRKNQIRRLSTRSKTLYDNCVLQAPDGEVLCTIDRKKAQWYLTEKLGLEVKSDPLTVRLSFEPAGRAVGEVGRYYQAPKENQCVVCGWQDVYIRKNVVPREYRKHFPVVMKSHTSHDVLLLCPDCHQQSNIADLKVRSKLAKMCDAPISQENGAIKTFEDFALRRLRAAARALLHTSHQIPPARKEELKQMVLEQYPSHDELSEDILVEAANVNTAIHDETCCRHGEKVVETFKYKFGGLVELEKIWRQHFLRTMQPKFLPPLWNVNHNAERLQLRALEGRVEKNDLILAGLSGVSGKQLNKREPTNTL